METVSIKHRVFRFVVLNAMGRMVLSCQEQVSVNVIRSTMLVKFVTQLVKLLNRKLK